MPEKTKKKEQTEDFRDAPPLLVRVTQDTRKKAEALAAKQHWSLSQLGSIALDEYLTRHAK